MALATGLIGFGAVGGTVAKLIGDGLAGPAALVGVVVRDPARHAADAERLGIPFVAGAAELIALGPEVVVEAGGHDGLRRHVPAILAAGIDVLAISVGALADADLLAELERAAVTGGGRLCVPSGAIAGLDAISAAAVLGLDRVVHTVRKPPASLLDAADAEAVVRSGVARELFAGSAREAAPRFPANVNVAAAVSLAGIGFERTEVRVIADPAVERNTHEVLVEGAFGRLSIRIENTPSDENPKTGRIVAASIARTLRGRTEPIVIGG